MFTRMSDVAGDVEAELREFDVDPDRGFLPSRDPLTEMPHEEFAFLDDLSEELPDLLESGELRPILEGLEARDVSGLSDRGKLRALAIYAFLAGAYVHALGEPARDRIPAGVAVPLHRLSRELDKPPILSYNSYVLQNWRRKDPDAQIEVGNLEVLFRFTHLRDEEWFILLHTEIEAEAAPALRKLREVQHAVAGGREESVRDGLEVIGDSLREMTATLERMPEECRREVFYKDFRPYIQKFHSVVYEGVAEYDGEPQDFAGETAAQSSTVPAFVAGLGLEHEQTGMTDHLTRMKRYMPKRHRGFIRLVERGDSVRRFVEENPGLADAYNRCLEGLWGFRDYHLHLATTYIHEKVDDPSGTGGTPFMKWLKQLRDETRQHKI